MAHAQAPKFTLYALPALLLALFILAACGGGATPDEDTNDDPSTVSCAEAPFDSTDTCEAEKNTFCILPANVFTHTGCMGLDNIGDIRTTFCALPANIFAHAECEKISNINALRTTFCEMSDNLFNAMCISRDLGGNQRDTFCNMLPANRFNQGCIMNGLNDNGRVVFCAIPGNRFNQMCIDNGLDGAGRANWCADPANRFNQMCIDNNLGDNERANFCAMPVRRFEPDCITNNLGGDGRTTFCAMSENRFNADCITNMLGGDGRTTFCGMPENRFDMDCIDNNLGDDDRDTFCATLPANRFNEGCIANDLGDNERDTFCAMLPTNRFNEGCIANDLGDDERDTFCGMSQNLFNMGCLDNNLGDDGDRDNACLTSAKGSPADESCRADRPEVINTCKMNPFDTTNTGCENLNDIITIKDTYCAGTQADSIADGSAANECNVDYADWAGGFTGTLTTAISTTDNHFLGDITTTTSGLTNLDLNTAKFDGRALGGDAESGLGFSTNTDGAEPTYQAGIFTTTNLGRPIETTTGIAKWNGSFRATNMDAAEDFTLHINFTSRAIAGIVRDGASENNYYYVNGSYTEGSTGGLIAGMVQYGEFSATAIDLTTTTRPTPSGTPTGGILSGIIGSNGAIGVFVSGSPVDTDGLITGGTGDTGFAGGFVVNPVAKIIPTVNYGDWARGFNVTPPTTPATSPALNQFLNGGTDRLATAVPVEYVGDPPALDFDNIYGGSKIDSDSNNGVAWFSVTDSPSIYYYAGIFPTTDLGLPVTGKTATTAMWSGQFRATGIASAVAFDLEVTFGNAGVGEIAAFVPSGTDHYLLTGTYTADGVISGTVNFGAFTDGDRTVPTNSDDTRKGILTGLIGSNGAVGAFVSGTAIDADGVITGGTGATGYAGGFVATPFAGKASYRTWLNNVNPPATPAAAPPSGNLNQFVQSIGNDVISAAHIGQSFNVNLGSLNGDPADGFNVYYITATDDYLVGLSSSTSVGVPLTSAPAAAWDGSFVVYEDGVATTTAFKLNINFSTSQLSATVGDYSFSAVNFQSNGLFRSSNMTHTPTSSTGSLQGLIGVDGAVGVFRSDSNAAVSYAGGFIAASPPCITLDNCVNHANWLASFGASPPPATRATSSAGTTVFGGFLNLADGVRVISETDLTNVLKGTLTLDGDGTNGRHGVTYLTGINSTNNYQSFVAVLPTTNLGAPLVSAPIITTWPGKYYHTARETTPDIDFVIDFGGTAISATDMEEIQPGLNRETRFTLRFTPATGVITGNVTDSVNSATVRGLIGTDGLVGVFVHESPSQAENTGVYFGGFIADNPNN